jgi:hypothetical protein
MREERGKASVKHSGKRSQDFDTILKVIGALG